MEREFCPEALEDWAKGCAGCVARGSLDIAFIRVDKACIKYNNELHGIPKLWGLGEEHGLNGHFSSTKTAFSSFMDWQHRLVERHRLSNLAVVLLYYLSEQYGELGEHLRDGIAASDEYIRHALDGAVERSLSFERLKQEHDTLYAILSAVQGELGTVSGIIKARISALHEKFTALEAAYNDVVTKTSTVWEILLPYQKKRAAQAFKISISGE